MYKVLLVEDEKYVREGIRVSVDWIKMGLTIVGEASEGDEGLHAALSLRPDIVLTDVRMPGMNGIEMAKRIIECMPQTKIIVSSGYDDYEYMRQALVYGFCDYLLKPIKELELEKTLRKAISEIKCAEEIRKDAIIKRNIVSFSEKIIEKEFGNKIISGEVCEFPNEKLECWRCTYDQFAVAKVIIKNFKSVIQSCYQGDENIALFAMENIMSEVAGRYEGIWFFNKYDKKNEFIFINGAAKENGREVQRQMKMFLKELFIEFETYMGIVLNAGISEFGWEFSEIARAYEEAEGAFNMLSYGAEYEIICYRSEWESYKECIFSSYENAFIHAVKKKAFLEIEGILEAIYLKIGQNKSYPKKQVHENVSHYIWLCQKYGMGIEDAKDILNYKKTVAEFATLEETWEWFDGIIRGFVWSENSEQDYDMLLDNVKEYIDRNLMTEDISLNQLAKHFYTNPYRLSKLFKAKYQENFQKYVVHRRIEKAKELLADSEISVSDIADMTGYKDEKYFFRIFKKYTGYTPREYRKMCKMTGNQE